MFGWKSAVPLVVILAIIVAAFILCHAFGTVSVDGSGFSGSWEFSF